MKLQVKGDGASVVLETCPNIYSLGYLVCTYMYINWDGIYFGCCQIRHIQPHLQNLLDKIKGALIIKIFQVFAAAGLKQVFGYEERAETKFTGEF